MVGFCANFSYISNKNLTIIFFQSGGVNICSITDDAKNALKKFRFSKAQETTALICKLLRI